MLGKNIWANAAGAKEGRASRSPFFRNIGAISKPQQQKLSNARVCIAGLGGIGGIAFELLVRSGVGKLRVADWDFFEETNLNRQALADSETLGKNKAKVAAVFAKKINPKAKIESFPAAINEKNANAFVQGATVVVDCTDNAYARVCIARACRKSKIPYVFCSALGTYGMCSVFFGGAGFEKTMKLPSAGKKKIDGKLLGKYQSCGSILGVVSNTVGALGAMQALKLIVGWPAVRAPDFLVVDAKENAAVSMKRL